MEALFFALGGSVSISIKKLKPLGMMSKTAVKKWEINLKIKQRGQENSREHKGD